jgi:Holliday junction resolvasome RuvABC endonuclease subunit
MRYIGLDIATTSGWAFFDDDVLIERGTIQLIPGMELPQKLHYFHLELKNLLNRLKPEYCFIEDVILGISGAKTLAYLARMNGVAINTSFEILQERVKLYTPTYWKANSFDGLGGMAKKWQVQLAVIKHYNIPITGNFESIDSIILSHCDNILNMKADSADIRVQINKLKASLVRKRNPLTIRDVEDANELMKVLNAKCLLLKSDIKSTQKAFDKTMLKISNDITAQTGFTDNIADACGIAYCGYKEVSNV